MASSTNKKFDEFGIPIRTTNNEVDEFGIPLKKKGQEATGGVSPSGSVPTQPGNGLSVSQSGDVTPDNRRINVKFYSKTNPKVQPIGGAIGKFATTSMIKTESDLTPEDVEYITGELLTKAQATKGYDADFFATKSKDGVNKDYATKFLRENAARITYKNNKPLTNKDIEVLNTRWIEKLSNQKTLKPYQVDNAMNKLWMGQTKKENPNLYKQLNPPAPQTVQKGKELKWEETTKDAGYFDKDLLGSLTESEKNALGSFLIQNKGVKQKMDRFNYGSVPKELQKDVIAQALGKQAQEAAARIQIYADKGDTEKMKKLSTLQNELTSIQAQQKILQNSINENDFDNTNMPPEQKAELDGLKSQYQVLKTEYTNDKNDFDSLKKEMQPVFDRITQLEQGLKESPEFITLKAKIDPIIKQLEALSPLVQQGDTNAIIRNNQLVEYYKNDFQKYDALAKEQDAKFQEYKQIYDENKSNIDLYNERIKSLTSLETEMNSKADEFNAFVTRNNPQQLSKVDQYKLSIDKYNNLVNKAAPLYEEYKNLYGELGEQAITDIGESVLKLNQFSDFQKRMEAEREPSMREMMLNSPFNNTKILDYTVFPFVAETAKFVSQSIAGGIKVVGELGETLTFKPEDYYSFADWASDVVQFGYDGTGKYWTDTVLPGLRKSDFVDPFTGELVYSPASVIVGSFEQMGQIAGAALTTYGSMGLGMGRNAAIVTPMFLATYENNIGLAKQLGFEGSGATQAGILFSMIEGFSELIFPDIDFFQGAAKKEAFKMFLDNFSKGGARMATKRFLETTGKELGEEYVVELGKYMATMSTRFFNGQNKVYELDPAQLLETTIFVFTSAGTGAAVQAKLTTSKTFNESMMFRMAMDLETSIPMIEQYNTLGKINNEKAEALKKNLKVISAIQGQLPNDISTPKKIVISGLYAQIASLEEKINDPNLTEEIKDSYKQSTKKMKALIAQVMMTDDAEFTKRYNEEMEAQGKAVSEEISKAHPDLGVATSYLDRGKQIQLSEQDQLRMQILDDIFKDSSAQNKADALEQRMNNTEEISMTEINNVLDGLYKQVEMVMDNYFDNEAGKQYAQALLDKIDKIKSYEFATDKETAVVTERKAVQTARASLQETASVINLARAPRRTATITSEDGTTGTYSIEVGPDGTVTFEQPNAEPIRVGNVNDVNKTAKIVETVLNEKGLPQSVSFSVTDQNGKLHTITVEAKANLKPQQLLDLAINIRANELGTVDPTDFDEAYEEVTREVEVGKTYPNMPVLGEMSDEEYFDFLDNGNVSNERIMDIARKVMTNQELTTQENEIFTDKTAEINQIIKTYKPYRNAVQEQAAGQVPVQPETGTRQEMAEGKPQAEPQAPAQKVKVQVAPVTQQETVESIRLKAKRANLDKATERIISSLKESGIDVRIIEDEAEFDAAVGMGGTNGLFDDQNGVVYVNPSRMKLAQQGNRVLFHESTHPVLNILYNTDKPTYDRIMKGMMDAAKKGLPMWQDLQNFRQRYIDRGYSKEQADNELMTETIGRIINGEIGLNDIPVGWRQAIVDMLNKIAKLLRLKPIGAVTDAGKFRDFAASLKDAFEKGRSISTIVGAENVKKFQSPFVEEQLSIMGIDQAQFLEMTKQMATDVESMVVPGNITNGWIQTGTKGGEQVVKFTGEATLENIREHAIDSYINRAYNLAQYDLSGIDVKGDFLNKLVGIDAKQKALFEKSFFNVARTEIQKIIDSSKLNKAEKDTKEDLDRKKRTKDALKQALKINDIGQLYDAIEAIGKDMDVISSSLITSLFQKRDFVYDETVKSKIDRWNDQKKRGVRDAAWVTRKISELVFAKRNNEAMANEADGIYENMKTKVKENLRFIYDLVNPAIRNLTKLWYDGANVIAQEFGSKYNLSLEQTAGIIASQSPQMPWFSNLHLAQTIMDIMMTKGNEVFTKQQYDYYVAAARGYAKQRAYIPTVKGLIGKRLNELSDYDAGIFIRSYYDLNMSRKAPKRLPSGVIVSYETGDSSFSSYDTIEKGVSIFRDGSVENISANLGEANKVRNFYNNIVDPTNINSVTIDTHAMAVSLIMPFGASDTEIKFDSGSYAFYSDSYNELARELNLGARELQSITWEAIRAFFPDNVKTAKFKGEIADIWNRYSKGIITIDQARNEILNKGQDANKTEWSDSIQDWMDGKTGTDYFRPIDRKGDVPGTASGRAGQGIGGGVPTVAGADIREGRDVLGRKPSVGRKTKGQPSLVEGQEFESTINGETVVLKPVDVDVVNGFYSPLEQEVFGSNPELVKAVEAAIGKPRGQASLVEEGNVIVYHAGTLDSEGNIYLTPRIKEANEYASMNQSKVLKFQISTEDMAPENIVRDTIKELGLTIPKDYNLNELLLHEILDTRFESSLSKNDINKLYEYLKQKGYSGISFIDEDILQIRKEGVTNYLVFDKNYLTEKGKPIKGQASLMDDPAPIIEQFGRKAESFADAEQALSNGDYVFLSSEMDGIPYLANDIQSLKANYDEVIIVKKEDYPIPAASKYQVDNINKKLKRGQPSYVESTVLGNPAAMAQQQYPLYQAMLPLGIDAFDNGARDVEAFKKYLGAIQWPNAIERDYHTMTVWDDVIRIKENKKPLINSQSDYEKMVRNLSYSHASNVEAINKKKSKIRKQFFKEKTWFDSRASFFKALARQSGELWNIVSAYTHTIGGMTEKGIFQANLFMSTTYDGLSNTQNIPYNGMLYSERMLLDEMLTLFGYIETNRKMKDKFDEFIRVEQDYRNETDPAKKEALKDQRDILKDYLDRNNVLSGNGRSIPYSLSDFKRSNLDMMSANVKLSNLSTAYPELFDKLSKRADAYFEAWKTLLKMRLDAKMISRELFDELSKYNYVPTKFVGYLLRDISDETDVKLNESTTKQIERLMGGSEDQLVMAHDESLKFAAMAVSRSIQKNRAVEALSRAIDANPNAITFYKPEVKSRDKYGNATEWVYDSKTKGLIKYYVDGKLEAIATEKEVADAFNGKQEAFDMPEGLGWMFMSTPFRMVTTNLNPAFGLAQIVIDLNQALLANDAYATVLYGAPAVLFRDLKLLSGRGLTWVSKKMGLPVNLDSEWNELFTEAREYGALISFTQSETFETALERKAGLNSRTDKFLNGDNMFAKTKRGIEDFNTSLEYVTRLAIYRKVRNNLIDKYIKDNNGNKPVGQALDDIRTEAAAASMNMLNYNRGGTWIKPLNRVMAYLNVGFQVPYSIFQNFKKSPYLTSLKASELIVYGALAMAQLYRMLDDDDKKKYIEYYNRLSPYEKSSYWHYPNPFRDPKDPDTFLLRFKKPSILLPMINTVEVIAMYSVTDGKTQSPDNYLTSVPDAYTPSLTKDFYDAQPFKAGVVSSMPTVNAAMIGFGNFDLYRMQYVVPKEQEIANPREGLEDPNVSQFYKYLSQINVEPKYMASGNVLSPKRMDEATKALIGDYTRNPVTSYPSLVFGAVMNAASTGYRDANKFVPEQPEKSLVNTIIEGSGFTQRFSTRISPLKPVTKKTINEQQVLKNAIYDTIRLTLDGMIQREERPDRYLIRQYFTDNLENQREMFTVEEYETLLEKIVMYSQRGSKIKEIEDRYLWVKPFILAPSKVEKSIIWESETSNYTYDEKIEVLRWLVLNDLFIPGKDMQLDESIAKDLKKFRK